MRLVAGLALSLGAASTAAACADTLSRVPTLALPVAKPGKQALRDFDFAKPAACLAAGDVQQRVLVFAIGDYAPPLSISVDSTPRRGTMLAPEVRVYDRAGKQLAAHDFTQFRHRGETYALTVYLNDAAAAGGYLAIAADPASLGRKSTLLSADSYYVPIVTPVAMWNFFGSTEGRRELSFAEAGAIRVRVESGEPRAMD